MHDPSWFHRTSSHDAIGQLTFQGDGCLGQGCANSGLNFYARDPFGRPGAVIWQENVNSQTVSWFEYDGLTTTQHYLIATPGGEQEFWRKQVLDGFGRLIRLQEPSPEGGSGATTITRYVYDAADRLVLVNTAANGSDQTRTFIYDGNGNLRQAVEPEAGTTNYFGYDARGHLLSSTDAAGVTLHRSYDCADRLIAVYRDVGGNPQTLLENRYDEPGRLTYSRYRNRAGLAGEPVEDVETWYEYGSRMGRLSKVTMAIDGVVFEHQQRFDDLGLPSALTYPTTSADVDIAQGLRQALGLTLENNRGFPWKILDAATGQPRFGGADQTGYMPNGQPGGWYMDALNGQLWDYDSRGRIQRIYGTAAGASVFDSGEYAYDPSGNIFAIGQDGYGYYGNGALRRAWILPEGSTTALEPVYGLDGFGNLKSRTAIEPFSAGVDLNTNRLQDVNGLGLVYGSPATSSGTNGTTTTCTIR